LGFTIAAGQVADCAPAFALLNESKNEAFIGDQRCYFEILVEHIKSENVRAVVPPRFNRKAQQLCDRLRYRKRTLIERCFSKLKQYRRVATRWKTSRTRSQ
jgi:hypothetical protein